MAERRKTDSQKAQMIRYCRMLSGDWKVTLLIRGPMAACIFHALLRDQFLCVDLQMPLGLIISHTLSAVSNALEFCSLLFHTLVKFYQ